MEGLGLLFLLGFAVYAVKEIRAQRANEDFDEKEIEIEQLREGIKNKWYDAKLTVVNDMPAVYLSGKTADGKDYADVFAIKVEDWKTLKGEGMQVIEYGKV